MRNDENQRYGRNKATTINRTYIESGAYRRKFDGITPSEAVNRALYLKAKEMLKHRSGTQLEDMYWFDGDTGRVLASVLDSEEENCIIYRKNTVNQFRGHKNVIALHTHPHSMPPSISDFNVMVQNGYAIGLVLCHNGKIFRYDSRQYVPEALYSAYIADFKKDGYRDYDAQWETLRKLSKNYSITVEEVDGHEKGQ